MGKVPQEEINQRIGKFRTELAGAFILQNADRFCFFATIQTAVLFILASGEPILMVQKNLKRARLESGLKNVIRVLYRNKIPRVLSDFKFGPLTSAELELDVLPAKFYLWFQRTVLQCRWMDISGVIRKLRMIKSADEIGQI